MRISVVIPTYNEKENISELIQQILALNLNLGIVVVDDNSPDGTGQIVNDLAQDNDLVSIIHRPEKLGLGTAYIAGFKKALADEADLIMTMDADFSHQPQYIPDLVELAKENHVTIGSRYVPGGGVENWEWYRKWLSWGANHFAHLMLNLKIQDCTAGFRCYHREVLLKIALDQIFSDGYSFLLELAYECQRVECRFGETPIIFANRTRGKSKISQKEIFKAMYTVARLSLNRLHFWQAKIAPIAPIGQSRIK